MRIRYRSGVWENMVELWRTVENDRCCGEPPQSEMTSWPSRNEHMRKTEMRDDYYSVTAEHLYLMGRWG